MTQAIKNLVYFERWMDLIGPEIIEAAEQDISLQKLAFSDPEDGNWELLAAAHGYQLLPTYEIQDPYYPTKPLIDRCPNLLAFSVTGAGYDMIDVDACTDAGILVVNQSGANAESVAQHVLGMMLVLCKRIVDGDRQMRRGPGDWGRWDFKGKELTGRTIGIIGLGNVGRRVAALGAVFGMKVIAYDPYISEDDFRERGAKSVSYEEIFATADFVSVNCPLTEETANMIGEGEYGLMKPTAYFITTARGGIHDEGALAVALGAGKIAGAGLDVFDPEPPSAAHPLMAFDNVIMSPHVAGITDDCLYNMSEYAAKQWLTIFQGHRPPRLINPDAWPHYRERFEKIMGVPVQD